jgi:DNA replication protein DnaC
LLLVHLSNRWRDFCNELNSKNYDDDIWKFKDNMVSSNNNVVKLAIYDTLLNHKSLSPLNNKALVIQGQPGIGKSTFAIFIMKKVMLGKKSFLFSNPDEAHCYGWDNNIATVYTWNTAPALIQTCFGF